MSKRLVIERDWSKENLESLTQLARNPNMPLERGRMTLWRWATAGVEVNGTVVVLPSCPTGPKGRNLQSSVGAVHAFLATISKLNGQSGEHWRKRRVKPAGRIKE